MARKSKKNVELHDELKGGISNFEITGRVKLNDDSFGQLTASKNSPYKYVNTRFGLEISEGITVWVQLMDGYHTGNSEQIMRLDKNGEKLYIPWEERNNQDYVDQVRSFDLFRAGLKNSEEDGRIISEKFVSGVDLNTYLYENMSEGMKVTVRGEVEYNEYNGDINRNYSVQAVYLAEDYEKDGKTVHTENKAIMRQTYLVTEDTPPRKWKKELEETERLILSVKVPQYVGKRNGKEVRKTLPLPQAIVLRLTESLDLSKAEKVVNRLFKVDKDTVRELVLINDIVEGYEQAQGEVENNAELQELIDEGIMSEDEVKKQVTIRGNRISEVAYKQPFVRLNKETNERYMALDDEKYSLEALVVEDPEDDSMDMDDEEEELFGEVATDDEIDEFFQ